LLERGREGVVQGFLGEVEIAEQADQGGEHAARFRPVDRIHLAPGFGYSVTDGQGSPLHRAPGAEFRYTNASWTLKADLTSEYVCRLLNNMDRHGYTQCTPHNSDPSVRPEPFIDFSSSYVLRSIDKFPKQGSRKPWRLYQNYALDILTLRFGKIEDGAMRFSGPDFPAIANKAA
jgi:hypothetical protein